MSTKAMTFQPAPRPQPRVSPQQTRDLAEATRDLGFGRTTSAPEPEGLDPSPASTKTVNADGSDHAKAEIKRITPATAHTATLKVAMPDETWAALRHEALNRRVTVKYLVMEALAAKGYDVDMSQIAEDGRRDR